MAAVVEAKKKEFVGSEIKGKKLGVVGLGAIGVLVANDALALGMFSDTRMWRLTPSRPTPWMSPF